MKRLLTIALFIGFSVAARSEDVKSPEELLVAFMNAAGNSDFESVVNDVHPSVLKSFKEHTATIVEAAVEDFSKQAVLAAFHGLESLEELDGLSDKEFWVYVMSNVCSIYPEFDGAKGIDVVGNVQDGDFLYVLFRRDRDLKSTDKIEKLKSPMICTFRKDGERWCYWSFAVSAVEKYVRRHAAIQHARSNKASEQDGADQPATAPESKSENKDKPHPQSEAAPR